MQLLQFELSYSRADHEAWLRGPGREEMADARKEVGVDGFKDEAEFDAEVAMQMQMFDRCGRLPCPGAPPPLAASGCDAQASHVGAQRTPACSAAAHASGLHPHLHPVPLPALAAPGQLGASVVWSHPSDQ